MREADEGAAAAAAEGPSGSQLEDGPGTSIPTTPAARPAGRRDSLTLSTMLKQQKASGLHCIIAFHNMCKLSSGFLCQQPPEHDHLTI